MQWNIKELLKFLFPEWQVIDMIKKEGFIAKKENRMTHGSVHPQQQTKFGHSGGHTQKSIASGPSTKMPSLKRQNKVKITEDGSAQLKQKRQSVPPNHVEESFDMIRTALDKKMIGQRNYLDQLCLAFKRPFVTGFEKGKPKNT